MPLHSQHTLINGDSRQMNDINDESIHLVITSPPYWQLKDYGSEEQIGFDNDYETYINNLNLTWQECFRVLHKGCRLCINIGDQFARAAYYGRYKIIPIHTEIIKFCEIIGFDFMGQIIWQKATTMNTSGGASIMGSYPYPRNGIVKLDYEFILLFKKPGNGPKPSQKQKEKSAMTTKEWNTYFNGHWNFPGVKQDKHLAMFPVELPYRLIKMFSFAEETVLDPFLGSGTTALAAKKLGRNSIGYEINSNFNKIIESKLEQANLEEKRPIRLVTNQIQNIDFKQKIEALPYQFKDTHKLNKQIDVKKKTFGSKFDQKKNEDKLEYFSVKKIISPEQLLLNNQKTIKLLGIKTNPVVFSKAVDYLTQKLKNQKVYLKYDDLIPLNEKQNDVYVYLKNKTFINAHLLKKGLAFPDNNVDFKFKDKFQKLTQKA